VLGGKLPAYDVERRPEQRYRFTVPAGVQMIGAILVEPFGDRDGVLARRRLIELRQTIEQ